MAMNKQRRTSNINNIVVYDALGNVILPASLTVKGFTTAGFVKTDVNGLLSVDTGAYLPMPSQSGNSGKYLTTDGSILSWGTVSTANIYNSDGTLTGNRTISTTSGYTLTINPATTFNGNVTASYINSGGAQLDIGNWGITNLRFINHLISYDKDGTNFIFNGKINIFSKNDGTSALAIASTALGYTNTIGWTYNGEFSSGLNSSTIAAHDFSISLRSGGRLHFFADGNAIFTNSTPVNAGYKLDVQGTGRFTGTVTMRDILDPLGSESLILRGVHPTGYNGAIAVVGSTAKVSGYTQGNIIVNSRSAFTNLTGTYNTIIGAAAGNSLTTGSFNVMIGSDAGKNVTTSGTNTYIGFQSHGTSSDRNVIQLTAGGQSYVEGVTTDMYPTNQNYAFIGGGYYANDQIQHFYFGAAPLLRDAAYPNSNKDVFFYAPSASQVTDRSGGNFTINAGRGTGTGTPGDVIISTATPTTSGTTLQTLTQRMWVKGDTGNVGIGASPNAAYKLDVTGQARISQSVVLGGEIFGPSNTYFNGPTINTGNFNLRYANANLPATTTSSLNTGILIVDGGNNTEATVRGNGVTSFKIANTATSSTWLFENKRNAVDGSLEISNSISSPTITLFPTRNIAIGSYTDAGYKLDVSGTGRFTNTLSVITTGTTNDVALFKSTEPYITIEAAGGSNSASIFLKPSTSSQNATIQNRTGGGIEFYTGATPSLSATIKSTGAVVVSSTLGLNGVEDSVKSGKYTPTLTNGTNVASSAVNDNVFKYIRVGSTVHVSGWLSITATASSTLTELELSLPIASNITSNEDVSGVANTLSGGYGQVRENATNNTAKMYVQPTSTSNLVWYLEFSYTII